EAEHAGSPRRWVQDARQHLERGRLAGAVRSDERDPLAGRDGEGHVVDGDDLVRARGDERAQRAAEPARTHGDAEHLPQTLELDRGGCHVALLRGEWPKKTPFRLSAGRALVSQRGIAFRLYMRLSWEIA